jgi:transcriptional regulator with XRE-family HTH domain
LCGVSVDMISKVEQGRRVPRTTVLMRLANALDVPLSELVDNRPRLNGRAEGASVLAIRDALLSAADLTGSGLGEDGEGEPTPLLLLLREAVAELSRLYWGGEFGKLAAVLPALIAEARFAWVMLHQGRLDESERLAARAAERVESTFSASDTHVAVFGSLLMTALAPAAAAGREVGDYVSMASAAAGKLGRRVPVYQTSFAPATVHMQACHAHAVLGEPDKALDAARQIRPGDLTGISHGRHLLDVAQAHADAPRPRSGCSAERSALPRCGSGIKAWPARLSILCRGPVLTCHRKDR